MEFAIPPEYRRPRDVEDRWRAQRKGFLVFARRARQAVSPGKPRIVARGAGARSGTGEDRVEEQHPAEIGLGFGIGIARWKRNILRSTVILAALMAERCRCRARLAQTEEQER